MEDQNMDKQRICKICNRRFANGKAMGGHMRSHLAKLPLPPKPDRPVVESATARFSSSSSSLSFHSSKDLMQTTHHRSVLVSESEMESPRINPTKRRSERRRRATVVMNVVAPPPSPPKMVLAKPDSVSLVTENFSVEEVALWLLKLSRDKWPSEYKQVIDVEDDDEVEEVGEEEEEEEYKEDEEEEEEVEELVCATGVGDGGFRTNGKIFKCEKCNKCFPSYQSLGGHKASHKKVKTHHKRGDGYVHLKPYNYNRNDGFAVDSTTSTIAAGAGSSSELKIQRNFECPFCDKVFESGQALGGHKKVHFSYLSVSPKPPAKSSEIFNIDLNLPAPEDDSEVIEV